VDFSAIDQDMLPAADATYNVGSAAYRWDGVFGVQSQFVDTAGAGAKTVNRPWASMAGLASAELAGAVASLDNDYSGYYTTDPDYVSGAFNAVAVSKSSTGKAYVELGGMGSSVFGASFAKAGSTTRLRNEAYLGGFLAGTSFGDGGTSQLSIGTGAPGAFVSGFANGYYGGDAQISASAGGGAFVGGYVYSYGTGTNGLITTAGTGGFAQGSIQASYGDCRIRAYAGSFAQGFCGTSVAAYTANIDAAGSGFAQGQAQGTGAHSALISSSSSFAQGRANGGSIRSSYGGFAQGLAQGGGFIDALVSGGFAQGFADGYDVKATAAGAFAHGQAQAADVAATAVNAVQFGEGTNAQADSLQVGSAGLRFKGTTGVPGTPQTGDFWVNAGKVYVQGTFVTNNVLTGNQAEFIERYGPGTKTVNRPWGNIFGALRANQAGAAAYIGNDYVGDYGTYPDYIPGLVAANSIAYGATSKAYVQAAGQGVAVLGTAFSKGAGTATLRGQSYWGGLVAGAAVVYSGGVDALIGSSAYNHGWLCGGFAYCQGGTYGYSKIQPGGDAAFSWGYVQGWDGRGLIQAGKGGFALGSAEGYYGNSLGKIQSGRGGFAAGRVVGTNANADITSVDAAFAFGRAIGTTNLAYVRSDQSGGFAVGDAQGNANGSGRIRVSGLGGFAQGRAVAAGGSGALLQAASAGFAQGNAAGASLTAAASAFAQGQASGYDLTATAIGSFAQGLATGYAITASGKGSMARGYADTAAIIASANNATQLGPGTNALADSAKIGGTFHFKGTTGAPAAPADGQLWFDAGFTTLYVRLNGVTRSVNVT
jgi:hypothetical protein